MNPKDLSKRLKKAEGATVKHARRFLVRRVESAKEVRRHIAAWTIAVGVVLLATGIQFYWYQTGYRTTAAERGGTYAEAVQGPVSTLNPLFAQTSAEESASELLFSRLLRYDETGHLNYDLADSMTLSDDQKTYTLTIRPDARWHDGLYVRARDVVFTVNLIKDSATRATITGWSSVKVSEVDARTVRFELPAVYAPFTQAIEQLPILPEHILRDVAPADLREASFSSKPVGSGPFAFRTLQEVNVTNGRKIVHLVRNNDYYGGIAKLDRFQLHVYESSDAIKNALRLGEVTAATDLTITDTQTIDSERYVSGYQSVNSGVYALFNTSSTVLKDVTVRRALQVGTDTAAVRSALADKVQGLDLPFLASQVEGVQLPSAPVYDVARANALLDEAGWKREGNVRVKDGKTLQLNVVTTKNNDLEAVLTVLSTQWTALGVSLTTTIVDPTDPLQNVAQNILQPRKYDVLVYRLALGGDPDVYAYWHSSQASNGYNFSNYANAISDEALVGARNRIEANLRGAKYATFAKQWLQDAPAVGLYQSTSQYVHSKNVDPWKLSSLSMISSTDRYTHVTSWTVGSRLVFVTP